MILAEATLVRDKSNPHTWDAENARQEAWVNTGGDPVTASVRALALSVRIGIDFPTRWSEAEVKAALRGYEHVWSVSKRDNGQVIISRLADF